MDNLIQRTASFLNIQRPFKLELVSKSHKTDCGSYWAIYSQKKRNLSHLIRVYIKDSPRSVDSIIAHEFVHAWQEEQGYMGVHTPEFIQMARRLSIHLSIPLIYDPEYDI